MISARARLQAFVLVLLALLGGAFFARHLSPQAEWFSVIPPALALALAFSTQNILLSLSASVLLGGVLLHWPLTTGTHWEQAVIEPFKILYKESWSFDSARFLGFVVGILSTIELLHKSGSLESLITRCTRFVSSAFGAQLSTYAMGLMLFIDDYANTMLCGSAMGPLADKHRVSRAKLAFIVDATSAPVAGVSLISTWVAYEAGLFDSISQSLNLGKNGYAMLLDALGFRFYCFFMLGYVLINILSCKDWGPMRQSQARSLKDGAAPMFLSTRRRNSGPLATVLSLGTLVLLVPLGFYIDGGGLARPLMDAFSPTAWGQVIQRSQNNITVLMVVSFVSYFLAAGLLLKRLPLKRIWHISLSGAKKAALPCCVLVLAWCVRNVCTQLQTGLFVADVLGHIISPIWWPSVVFLTSAAVAFATGSSWGVMSILIPITTPVAYAIDGNTYGITTMLCLAAVLDGSIFGDHASPMSDTTIMSSTACQCPHLEHVKTQLPYVLVVAAVACSAYAISAACQGSVGPAALLLSGYGVLWCVHRVLAR